MAYNSNYTGEQVENAIKKAINNNNRCELSAEGSILYLNTDVLFPENSKVVVYRYINRRQKRTSRYSEKAQHIRVKGWRRAERLQSDLNTRYGSVDYKYRYAMNLDGASLLEQATNAFGYSSSDKSGKYFRQRLAVEVQDENGNPLTPKMEFMMDYSANSSGVITKTWYCKIHQYTSIPE